MNYYIFLGIVLLIYISVWYLISLIKKRNDLADLAWGLGFVLLAWISFYFSLSETFSLRSFLVTGLVTIWGVRLSTHIYLRNKGREEDYRYKKWREEWKFFKLRSFFQVYILQGALIYLIAIPILVINKNPTAGITVLDVLAILIWIFGFVFESLADYQLKKFIKNPQKSGIMKSGLWRWSRHPNYFGETIQWWGVWLLSLSAKVFPLTIISPIMITFLILKVSGIPLLEEKMSKKPGFEDYKRRVNKFFPGPPKS